MRIKQLWSVFSYGRGEGESGGGEKECVFLFAIFKGDQGRGCKMFLHGENIFIDCVDPRLEASSLWSASQKGVSDCERRWPVAVLARSGVTFLPLRVEYLP